MDEEIDLESNIRGVSFGGVEIEDIHINELSAPQPEDGTSSAPPMDVPMGGTPRRRTRRQSSVAFEIGEGPSLQRHLNSLDLRGIPISASMEDITSLDADQHGAKLVIELFHYDFNYWIEKSRFIRYEEDIKGQDHHWSEPHVPFVFHESMQHTRKLFEKVTFLVDVECQTFEDVVDKVSEQVSPDDETLFKHIKEMLLKRAVTQKPRNRMSHAATVGMLGGGRVVCSAQTLSSNGSPERTALLKNEQNEYLPKSNAPRTTPSRTLSLGIFSHKIREPDLHPIKSEPNIKRRKEQESCHVLTGEVEGLTRYRFAMVRLKDSVMMETAGAPGPIKFFLFVLGPKGEEQPYGDIGKAMCMLFSNKEFKLLAYEATDGNQLVHGIDRFLQDAVLLPPGEIDHKKLIPTDEIKAALQQKTHYRALQREKFERARAERRRTLTETHNEEENMNRKQRMFEGLVNDAKTRFSKYRSDFVDAFHPQCLTSMIYIFVATIIPALTFGGLIGTYTQGSMGIAETMAGQSLCVVIWALAACQPLVIQSPTGPVLIYEAALFGTCVSNNLDYMLVRLYSGIFVFITSVVIVAFGWTKYLHYISRFVEDIFTGLISTIFIMESFKFLQKVYMEHPIGSLEYYVERNASDCHTKKIKIGNVTVPMDACGAEPNRFFFSMSLLSWTFVISVLMMKFRRSHFFTRKIRNFIADFGVLIAIITACGGIYLVDGVELTRLEMPQTLEYTNSAKRGYGVFIIPFIKGNESPTLFLVAFGAGVTSFILLFLETGITEQLLLRKERKLVKGGGMHYDILLMGFCTFLCSLLGLPWMCAAAVQTLTHVSALTVKSKKAPGEKDEIEFVLEQRGTTIGVAVFIALFAYFGSWMKLPMAALYGIFLYLGVMNLRGVQLMTRIRCLLVPPKYFPMHRFMQTAAWYKVHLYTGIQIVLFLFILAVKMELFREGSAIMFPFVLILYAAIRHFVLPKIFTEDELNGLDAEVEVEEEQEEADYPDLYLRAPLPF